MDDRLRAARELVVRPAGVTAVCTNCSDDSRAGLLVAERSLAAWSPKAGPHFVHCARVPVIRLMHSKTNAVAFSGE
jgi:hypothetical protein